MQLQSKTSALEYALSDDEIRTFHTNGFLGPFDLFSQKEMKEHWKRERLKLFDRTNVVYPGVKPSSGVYDHDRHLDNEFLAGVISQSQIVHRVVSLFGPDILCWRTEFFPKYPGDEGTDWHQADTFGAGNGIPHLIWPDNSDFGGSLTAWVALTDADLETACMQFIPGTQRTMFYDENKGMHYDLSRVNSKVVNGVLRGFFGYDWLEIQKDPNWRPDESKAVSVPCKAGQFLLFSSTLMHASLPHLGKSRDPRFAWAIRYVPTSVTIYEKMRESNVVEELGGTLPLDQYGAVLVSGRDEYGHNKLRTATTTRRVFANALPR
jgi:non-heme Fe2+,alpha-ketoglutarate-dependent halogenase